MTETERPDQLLAELDDIAEALWWLLPAEAKAIRQAAGLIRGFVHTLRAIADQARRLLWG